MFQPDLPVFYFIRFQSFGWLGLHEEAIIGYTDSRNYNWIYIRRDGSSKTGTKFRAIRCAYYLPALPVNSKSSWLARDVRRLMASLFSWHTIVKPIKPLGRVFFKVGFIYPAAFERLFPHNYKIYSVEKFYIPVAVFIHLASNTFSPTALPHLWYPKARLPGWGESKIWKHWAIYQMTSGCYDRSLWISLTPWCGKRLFQRLILIPWDKIRLHQSKKKPYKHGYF